MDASGTAILIIGPDETVPGYIQEEPEVLELPATATLPAKPKWTTLFISAGKKDKVNKVDVVLGDSSFPPGPISGGSWVTASMTPAVLGAARKAGKALLLVAVKSDGSPFKGKKQDDLELVGGTVRLDL